MITSETYTITEVYYTFQNGWKVAAYELLEIMGLLEDGYDVRREIVKNEGLLKAMIHVGVFKRKRGKLIYNKAKLTKFLDEVQKELEAWEMAQDDAQM